MSRPIVALVGRPNVGKSTLFNRLVGERLAVVAETAGTTRDRQVAEVEWGGIVFDLIDTGGIDPTTIGSGEPLSIDSADYIEQIKVQAEFAASSADLVLFIVDAAAGVTSADHEVAEIMRRQGSGSGDSRTLLIANKAENRAIQESAVEFYELGMGEPMTISALHGIGSGDLLDAILEKIEPVADKTSPETDGDLGARIAILGRPNVGKSSLFNKILGEERVLVSDLAGTTRDSIDTQLTYHGVPVTLIDTAGMRRRGKVEPGVEKYSVIRALEAVDRADVVLLLVDAVEGVTAQDAHIGGIAIEKYKSVVLLINKWDLVDKDTYTLPEHTKQARAQLKFLDYVPVLFISALTGQRVSRVLPTALEVQEERLFRIPTGRLNRVIQEALTAHAPPSKSGRRLNIMYASQISVNPPSFLFHVNEPKLAHFSYRRYLENKIRAEHPFLGTPIHLRFKARERE